MNERLLLRFCGACNRDEDPDFDCPKLNLVDVLNADVLNASPFVDDELIVELQVEMVAERENIEDAGSSLLYLREYVESLLSLWEEVEGAMVEEEDGILRRGMGMLSDCFPSLMLGN